MSTRILSAAVAAVATLALAACGSSSDDADSTSGGDGGSGAWPVTIEHAFGETTIEEKPERVATVAWANHEVPLALDVVPVGMAKADYGDDDGDGVLPWVEEKLTELDAETPELFDETDGIDFEAVANTEPDVILASYSGLTQEDYDTLSEIAPVVAYPDIAWGTTMDEMIEMNSTALGMEAEGQELISELDATIEETVADHPDLADKSAVFAYLDPKDLSQVGYYNTNDPRAVFLEDLGFTTPEMVSTAAEESEEFYTTVSSEQADDFEDVDLMISYGDDTLLSTLQDDALLSQIPAVENGSVAVLEDGTPLAASANPSPLSIDWGLDEYLTILDEAAAKAK
ncbi:iron-siderophore ABC transporter substrate-binding protein [Janibacter alkaliphilus]|uniref:Iron complex transport system substrate-binding protein n=1 Tax=Janibacter alkaliphilus TaxID=1069963 RepID=A0A852X639_9MICO|nr:iron-siderophore ABC transporter substrate-binding protein [Janibacter alkaliphilus]NYG35664.1 iron complex transport system substrate-binding protein [Janibacter alkaliphilus]